MQSTMQEFTDYLKQPSKRQTMAQELQFALGGAEIPTENLKKFQASYMVVYKTASVMQTPNEPTEQALLNAAVPMLETFERIHATNEPDTASFRSLFSTYIQRFDDFTAVDRPRLVQEIQNCATMAQSAKDAMIARLGQ